MSRHIRITSIVDRIVGDSELAIPHCDLRRAAVEVLISVCTNLDMPDDWVSGDASMHPDIVESLRLLLEGTLRAVNAELANPTSPLRAVNGGDA